MLPYAARQLIWMLQSAVQLVLAMSKGVVWVVQMVRLFIYVAIAWVFFVSTVMWYVTSANIIRLVAYRSSETTRRRNVLRVLEEEGVDLGPLLVREQRRVNERSHAGRRSLKDTHMGPGHGTYVSAAVAAGTTSSSCVGAGSEAAGSADMTTLRPAARRSGAGAHVADHRRRLAARALSETVAHDDRDSLGPAASAPQLRPAPRTTTRRAGPLPPGSTGRMYADLFTVERLLNLNPADGSALKSLPFARKTPVGAGGGASAASGPGGPHGRRPPPPPRRRPHSANTSITASGQPPPPLPPPALGATAGPSAAGNVTAQHVARRLEEEVEEDGRRVLPLPPPPRSDGRPPTGTRTVEEDVHYYADLPSQEDDPEDDTAARLAEKHVLAALGTSTAPTTSSSTLLDDLTLAAAQVPPRGDRGTQSEAIATPVREASRQTSEKQSPSPSRPYPPRRVPHVGSGGDGGAASSPGGAGPGPGSRAQRRRPPPPPQQQQPPRVSGVHGGSQGDGQDSHMAFSATTGSRMRASPRVRPRDGPPNGSYSPAPFLSATTALASPTSLGADLDEEDEEDRMNLHNRSTVDIILPVPMDSLMKTLDYANRNATLRRKKFPVVILITGGVWIIGSHMWGMLLARVLAQRGFVVFCPDYRNFPQTTMEGMVLDVSDAIAWVLNNAERYNGDLDDVTIIGHSCGAHLSMMSLLSQAHLAAVRQSPPHSGQLPVPSEVAYNVPRYHPRRAIHRFVGLSGMYDVESLEHHFSSKGLNSPVLARIAGGRENLARYSLHAYFDPYRRGTTGELLPDTIFDFLPARHFFLHGEHDKVTPANQSASMVGVMRQAQKDCALKRLTRFEEYRRHRRSMASQGRPPPPPAETQKRLDGEDADRVATPVPLAADDTAVMDVMQELGDPLPVAPADMEYVLILGAGHTDAVVEECLVGGRSCCVDFLCDYEAASMPSLAASSVTGEGRAAAPLTSVPAVPHGKAWEAVPPATGRGSSSHGTRGDRASHPIAAPGSLGSSEGLSGSVLSGTAAASQHMPPPPTATGIGAGDRALVSPSWSASRLSVSQCTQGATDGGLSAPRRLLGRPPSSASLSALSAPGASFAGDSVAASSALAASRRRTRSPAVPHEVPPDAWLPMSVPREQWPIALRIASIISPF